MKTAALQKLRAKLAKDQPVYGLWVTLESASISEMAVALGLDWIVIDAEHGHLDWKDILEHIRAAVRSETVVLVRVAELNGGLIKRALDIGADGVVVPWVETAQQLERALAFALYPPEGVRGIGAERATAWGQCLAQHAQEANEHVLVMPIIETVTAGHTVDDLCKIKGVDCYFFGPADYSSTAGFRGQWEGPGVAEALQGIKDKLRAHGKHCGVIGTSHDDLLQRQQQGFRLLGLGADCGLLLRSLHAALGAIGQHRRIVPSFVVDSTALPAFARPPESVRPDRPEVMNAAGARAGVELAPGILVEILVGDHNGARKLTTGLVSCRPKARLPYHTLPVSESITVLSGTSVVGVEGREYSLGPLDNIIIPRELAHAAWASPTEPSLLHVALASETVSRQLVADPAERSAMPLQSTGCPGKERVTRFRTAARSQAGPGTSFIDYFNQDLLPEIEMSGGYGLFQPGGRLPAHYHDFDESICIIEGSATCVVEGRRYQMSNCATALQPRGRVHYFVNESDTPMAMIWVYAGPLPERILVDERFATTEGNPWNQPPTQP